MTEKELVQLCKLGESTTLQYKVEFTTQKQIAEELVAFANTRGGIIIFGAEDKTGHMVGLTYEQVMGNSDPRNPQLAQFGSKTMPYRGLGSGIPRVMAENCDVELIDRPDGNQFIARIWRITKKDEFTTQKANEELISATQKEEEATQKAKNTTQKHLTSTQNVTT